MGSEKEMGTSGCTRKFPHQLPLLTFNLSVIGELLKTGQFQKMNKSVDEDEHSIEMHLPYIAKVFEK